MIIFHLKPILSYKASFFAVNRLKKGTQGGSLRQPAPLGVLFARF